MNKLIKANIEKLNRLVDVSRTRRSAEMDFFTEASNKYRNFLNYPLATNPNEDKSLADIDRDWETIHFSTSSSSRHID